jgi:DNA-binding HxlR family transcriptional regulator
MKDRYDLPCNIAQSLNIIGDRWTLLIIHEVLVGNTTFNQIKKSLAGLSSKLLSERLKYLEEQGLLVSTLYSEHPPRYRYTLTQSGRELEGVFQALVIWGRRNLQKCYKKMIHLDCQHEVELATYCPHCKTNVENVAVVELETEAEEIPTRS